LKLTWRAPSPGEESARGRVSHFQHLEQEGVPTGPALVLQGAKERLAPILMTASATGLALVPLAVAGSIPGHEIEHPMAIVILRGLITATLLNLFVLPSLYLRFGKGRGAELAGGLAVPAAGAPLLGKDEARERPGELV
jgi:predicted RND superfamily exporter protein